MWLHDGTWSGLVEGVEGGDEEVAEDCQIEGRVAPHGHVTAQPEHERRRTQLLLPLHLREHLVCAHEEVAHLAALLVALRRHAHVVLRLGSQVLADLRDRKHNLLHGSILTHDLSQNTQSQ